MLKETNEPTKLDRKLRTITVEAKEQEEPTEQLIIEIKNIKFNNTHIY